MLRSILAGASLVLLASACASSTDAPVEPVETAASAEPTEFELAMGTVNSLVEAGNEQIAIDRLTQLLGDPGMNDEQMAKALYARAKLRHGGGNDLTGSIADLKEIASDYATSSIADDAAALQLEAEAEFAMLNDMLTSGEPTAMERFEILFRLGQHQEAADLMLAGALEPENAYILDMYQIGYLCDGDELAGPVFELVEPDGTRRSVQFCELGK
ncbi:MULTISPECIES: hypothetical protein [Henriciella]|jgi:hypothetical protein|uniref:Lipoprotein n=1 Tax=Henriciella pelagia TaxID=1977912 RepID=A0ABQ1J4M6_9PROT|nr:hypothetical protein [Henriciella pelagia]GGB57726.1 hypothetical protein GCM10011503_02640 [Henriciella pelagia]